MPVSATASFVSKVKFMHSGGMAENFLVLLLDRDAVEAVVSSERLLDLAQLLVMMVLTSSSS